MTAWQRLGQQPAYRVWAAECKREDGVFILRSDREAQPIAAYPQELVRSIKDTAAPFEFDGAPTAFRES